MVLDMTLNCTEDSVSSLRLLFCYNVEQQTLVTGIDKPIIWCNYDLAWQIIFFFVDNGKLPKCGNGGS